MPAESKKMTVIRDIAAACGVSVATVSQVLGNNTRPVSAGTRERVLEAARALNYHPNAMARGLARSRTNTVGLVFLHTHRPLHRAASFVPMLDGVLERATLERLDTLIYTSYSWSDREQHISALLDRRCDGLILAVPVLDNVAIAALREYHIPFVLLCGQSDAANISTVDTDNEGAACDLIRHLMDLGHRRIAFVHLQGDENFSYSRDRLAGYYRAHRERSLPCDVALIVSAASVPEQVSRLMQMPPDRRPTAIFGVADAAALEIMAALQHTGWRVPEDVSVVGYDDIPAAAVSQPGLTTVRQPFQLLGERAVELLLAQIAGEDAPGRKELLPTQMLLRQSTAPPPEA